MRKHLIWYCRDFRGAAELRTKMVRVNGTSDVIQCLRDYEAGRQAPAHGALAAPEAALTPLPVP